jgi:hypothetical protein
VKGLFSSEGKWEIQSFEIGLRASEVAPQIYNIIREEKCSRLKDKILNQNEKSAAPTGNGALLNLFEGLRAYR